MELKEKILNAAMTQNFVSVVDDFDCFIGIVTRRDIMRHLTGQERKGLPRQE